MVNRQDFDRRLGLAWVLGLVVLLAASSPGPSPAQETIGSWFGDEWIEWEIPGEIWVTSIDRPAVESVLGDAGLTEYLYEGSYGCGDPTEMLFVRQDASGTPAPPTPVLVALETLTGGSVPNTWFWSLSLSSFNGGGRVISEYVAGFSPGTTLEIAAGIVEDLGVGSISPGPLHSPPEFRVVSSRQSGAALLLDINLLFEHPDVDRVYPFLASGCPSGGGGGGGGGGGTGPPQDIPTLGLPGALLYTLLLAFVAAALVRRER